MARSGAKGGASLGLLFVLSVLPFPEAWAFEYLEHSYYADRACRFAQEVLARRLQSAPAVDQDEDPVLARYLALAIACPNRWPDPETSPYCAENGLKRPESNIHHLPSEADGVAITLGDFAAIPDHLSAFGPVRGLPKAHQEDGFSAQVFEWLSWNEPDGAGGVVGDVSEDACEGTRQVPWSRIEKDLRSLADGALGPPKDAGIPLISPLSRGKAPRGPSDPAGAYSFDNPHFLDLVLRDNHHFGEHAFSAWLGYHTQGVDIANRECSSVIAFSADDFEDWSSGVAEFEAVDWDDLEPLELRDRGCDLLAERIRLRLRDWLALGDPALTAPVRSRVENLGRKQLREVASSFLGLIFEGGGLHFLQDGLSAGHLRAIHGRRGLSDRRYDHDLDSRDGLTAILRTAEGERTLVLFGDSYLLAPSFPTGRRGDSAANNAPLNCDWPEFEKKAPAPEILTACWIQAQRRVLVRAAGSSLLDWSLAGARPAPGGEAERIIHRDLLLEAPRVPGMAERPTFSSTGVGSTGALLRPGTLPVPPPPFAYESLSFQFALDGTGNGNQIGLQAAFFSELDTWANWMTTHTIGLRSSSARGDATDDAEFTADYSFGFHWRWAARFIVDGEPFAFAGLRNLGPHREFIAGIGPKLGITVLPEGWVKIPLELSLSYRFPITLVNSRTGFFGDAFSRNRHWFQFGIGLAFL